MTAALRMLAAVGGVATIAATLASAVNTLVLPRGVNGRLARTMFTSVRAVVDLATRRADVERRDQALALVAPVGLLGLPVAWLLLTWAGVAGVLLAIGLDTPWDALRLSGSSLLTLGFSVPETVPQTLVAFGAATVGLGLVTLLIAYLPTMYAAFSQREAEVALLEVRAGSPPSAVVMLERFHSIGRADDLDDVWVRWETWFAQLDETHTSLAALPLFRSTRPSRSWITAAGTVLDAAALYASTLAHGPVANASLCIRAGYTSLRSICDLYGIPYPPDPAPDDPIALTRDEYDEAYDRLEAAGYQMVEDRDQAWRDFAGWRVNYDEALLALSTLLEAPWAPWTADRSPTLGRPTLGRPRGARTGTERPE